MIFHMNQNTSVGLATESVDLRKSFNGAVCDFARGVLYEIPENGALFQFYGSIIIVPKKMLNLHISTTSRATFTD